MMNKKGELTIPTHPRPKNGKTIYFFGIPIVTIEDD